MTRVIGPRKDTDTTLAGAVVRRIDGQLLGPDGGDIRRPSRPGRFRGTDRPRTCQRPSAAPTAAMPVDRADERLRRTRSRGSRRARAEGRAARVGPLLMTPTRSAIARASCWSWVTNTVVTPISSWSRRISSRRVSRTFASSADSGSSSRRTFGDVAMARARATRCFWPPDIWCGYLSACSCSARHLDHPVDDLRALGCGPLLHLEPEVDVLRGPSCSGTGCSPGTPCRTGASPAGR